MLEYQMRITRTNLRNNPNTLYVFGDNLMGRGYGGQAAAMRGEPNAVGIPTKNSPAEFATDNDFDIYAQVYSEVFPKLSAHLLMGGEVIWPYDGIGTGLADLKNQAPNVWQLLQLWCKSMGIKNPYEED